VERPAGGILPGRGGGLQPHADAPGAAAFACGDGRPDLLVSPGWAGSVAGLTKHQGQSTHNYRYDAYGQLLPAQGNWTDPHNHYTFAGKEWDEHLGLYAFGVRLYDPWAGVWLTREPLPGEAREPRTWHRYQYAYASPISYYDPYGLQTCGFNILTGERACFGERTGMGWTPTVAWTPLPPAGFIALMPTGASCTPSYSVRASVRQAWSLVYEWFFEQGPSVRVLGPQDPLTRDIMHDPGVQAFRAAWAAAGYPVPWAWSHRADEREGAGPPSDGPWVAGVWAGASGGVAAVHGAGAAGSGAGGSSG